MYLVGAGVMVAWVLIIPLQEAQVESALLLDSSSNVP